MQFNDSVTTFDPREVELRELEVLIQLDPYVKAEVDRNIKKLEEERDEVRKTRSRSRGFSGLIEMQNFIDMLDDWYAPKMAAEDARVVRLRMAILERAERLFPELAAEEPQEDFSSGAQGEDGSLPARERESASGVSYVAGVVPGSRTESPMK